MSSAPPETEPRVVHSCRDLPGLAAPGGTGRQQKLPAAATIGQSLGCLRGYHRELTNISTRGLLPQPRWE